MAGLFAVLVTHFFVLLGIFPGALVVFSSTLGVSLAGGLVASSPGSQASGSLPRPGIQLQLKGSEMESRPGVPGRQAGRTGTMADTVMPRVNDAVRGLALSKERFGPLPWLLGRGALQALGMSCLEQCFLGGGTTLITFANNVTYGLPACSQPHLRTERL